MKQVTTLPITNRSASYPIVLRWWNSFGERTLKISSIWMQRLRIELGSEDKACKKQKYLQKNSLKMAYMM